MDSTHLVGRIEFVSIHASGALNVGSGGRVWKTHLVTENRVCQLAVGALECSSGGRVIEDTVCRVQNRSLSASSEWL